MNLFVSFLYLTLYATFITAQVYPPYETTGHPWFLSDNVQIAIQNDTSIINTYELNDYYYILTGTKFSKSLSICRYSRTDKTLRRGYLNIMEPGFPGFDPFRNDSDVALVMDPLTSDAHIVYTFQDKIGIQSYQAINTRFQDIDVNLNVSSGYVYSLPYSRTGMNPKIVGSFYNGSLLVGLYQHNTDNLTGLHGWFAAEFRGPQFGVPMNSYYSNERAYSITISSNVFRIQNATHAFYLRVTDNGLLMENIREVSSAKRNGIFGYSVTANDVSDGSTYYLYQEPTGWNEVWGETRSVILRQLDANDSFVREIVVVPFVPATVPYFWMDFKVTPDAVYCIFVSIQPLIFSFFLFLERRYGGTEIVLMKFNKIDFSYIVHTGVSSIGDDNGFSLYTEVDGSVFIIGTTNSDIADPWNVAYIAQNLTSVFVSRFQSFKISSFITPLSLSNASGYRIQELEPFSIVFSQDVTKLGVPNGRSVNFQKRGGFWTEIPSQFDSMNNLVVTAPRSGGNGMELIVSFWSHPHHPMVFDYSLSYDPPYVESVTPLNGPTTGGTQLRFKCLNIGSFDEFPSVEITVGGKKCTFKLYGGEYFTCMSPPGIGTDKTIIVSYRENDGKANVAFSYDSPEIALVQPKTAIPKGGSEISIFGNNFGSGLDLSVFVTIGNRNCTILSVSHRRIICSAPPGVGHLLDVFVSVAGQNATAPATFSYAPPELTSIYPTASRDSTGFVVIRGRNFGNDSSQLHVLFVSTNSTVYQPCSNITLIGEAFSDMLNCTLDGLLPKPDRYDVRISIKSSGQTSSATNTFETGSEKQLPLALPQNYSILEDSQFTFNLEGNSSNANDTLQFYITALPAYGKLYKKDTDLLPFALDVNFGTAILPNNVTEIVYIPNKNFNGQDTLRFQVCDSYFCGSSTEITLNVIALNDPPTVSNHSFTLDEDAVLQISLSYSDVDSAAQDLKIVVVSLPSGTLIDGSVPITSAPYTLNGTTVNYAPVLNRHGQPPLYYYSNFTYIAFDGVNYSTIPGAVTLNVRPVDDLPVATNLSLEMDRNPNLLINLECLDIDTAPSNLILKILRLPQNGTLHAYDSVTNSPGNPILNVVDNERRSVWFIPSREFIGRTEFSYECLDNTDAKSNIATVTISVNPFIDCVEEITLSSEFVNGMVSLYPIELSNRQANSERISFKIVKYPPKGVFFIGDGTKISEGDPITTNRIWFSSNDTGGADPYGNFTYIAIGPSNTSSVACTTKFKVVCAQSYLNVFKNNSGRICEPCAPGAVCSVNGLFTPYAERGFWRSSENNIYLPCFPESACPGLMNQTCGFGRTGIRCATCENGFYKFQDQCIQCTTQPTLLLSLITVAIILGGMLLVIASEIYSDGPSLGLLSITINFIQTVLIIRNFHLSWPSELVNVLDYLSFIKLNIDYSSPECLVVDEAITFNYSVKMKLSLLVPFILLVALGLCTALWKTILKLSQVVHRSRSKSDNSRQRGSISFIRNFNMLLSIVFISLAQKSLALFDCSQEIDQHYYLDADLSLKCFEKWWWADFPLAVVAVILYVIGIPFYFFMLYFCSHQNHYTGSIWIKAKSITQQIFKSDRLFQPQFQFFIFIQVIQKVLLAIIDMFFTRYVVLQSVLMSYILIFMFFIYYKHRPYAYTTLNILEMLSMVMSFFVVSLGQVFRSETLKTDAQRLGLTILILFIIFGFLLIALLCGFYEFHRKVRTWVMQIRANRTRGPQKKV